MTWTTKPPTVNGWYWWRNNSDGTPQIVRVSRGSPLIPGTAIIMASVGEWYGPLVPPTDEPVDTRIPPRGGSSTAPPKCDRSGPFG